MCLTYFNVYSVHLRGVHSMLCAGDPTLLCLWLELVRLLCHPDDGSCHGYCQPGTRHVVPGAGQTTEGRPYF